MGQSRGYSSFGCDDVRLLLDRIERYNEETIALLKESVKSVADEIKAQRCKGEAVSTAPGSCGDIQFMWLRSNLTR